MAVFVSRNESSDRLLVHGKAQDKHQRWDYHEPPTYPEEAGGKPENRPGHQYLDDRPEIDLQGSTGRFVIAWFRYHSRSVATADHCPGCDYHNAREGKQKDVWVDRLIEEGTTYRPCDPGKTEKDPW